MERCLGLTRAPLALSTVCAYGPYTCSLRDDSWNLTLIRWLPMRRFPYLCRSASIRLLHRICFRSPGNPYKYIFRICGCIYWSHTLSRFVFRHKKHQGPCKRNRGIQTLKVGWNGLSWWKRAHRWYLLVGPFVGGKGSSTFKLKKSLRTWHWAEAVLCCFSELETITLLRESGNLLVTNQHCAH